MVICCTRIDCAPATVFRTTALDAALMATASKMPSTAMPRSLHVVGRIIVSSVAQEDARTQCNARYITTICHNQRDADATHVGLCERGGTCLGIIHKA